MALVDRLPALRVDLAAFAGAVSYRDLANLLKVAIADAQRNGLGVVTIQTPTGTSMSYPSLNVAMMALESIEGLAAGEEGALHTARMRLK